MSYRHNFLVFFILSNKTTTVELQWLEHFWNHEIFSRQGKFELKIVNHSARSGGIQMKYFRFSLTLRYVVYSHYLMSTHNTPFSI